MLNRSVLIALALVAGAGTAQGQTASPKPPKPIHTTLMKTHQDLSTKLQRLSASATAANATRAQRQALVRFARTEVTPQLKLESVDLYTVYDSLIGDPYAVTANLFDLDAIGFLIREVERTAKLTDRAPFDARTYALRMSLESYFAKTQTLVLPGLNDWVNRGIMTSNRLGMVEKTSGALGE